MEIMKRCGIKKKVVDKQNQDSLDVKIVVNMVIKQMLKVMNKWYIIKNKE